MCVHTCMHVPTSCILLSSVNPPQQNKMTASIRDGDALASMPLILSKLVWKNSHVRSCPSLPEEETLIVPFVRVGVCAVLRPV